MSLPPAYGLLLDVDGPICSPETRSIVQPTILPNMVTLLQVGIPIVFNTGRSADFLTGQVFRPLQAAGLPANARVHGVCEKGGVWLTLTADGASVEAIDQSVAPPPAFVSAVRDLVAAEYGDAMFFDETKHAMVSVEQIVGVAPDIYYEAQKAFDNDVFRIMVESGIGVELHDRYQAPQDGMPMFRIEPTIISTDIESIVLGKDFGAKRALDLLRADGALPLQWRTVGDSRSDYKMADWLYANGHTVAHVDVRPADGVPETPYRVVQATQSVNDVAGARWLDWLVANLDSERTPEAAFDD